MRTKQVGPKSFRSIPPWQRTLVALTILTAPCISACTTIVPASATYQPVESVGSALPGLPNSNLALDEVVSLARSGAAADSIIARIRAEGAIYRLSANEIFSLRERGLPVQVIDYMLTAERRYSAGLSDSHRAATANSEQPQPAPSRPHRPIPALYLGV
jgi:hypothetical protein